MMSLLSPIDLPPMKWDNAPTQSPVIIPKTEQNTQLETPWNVIVHDDPVNLMEYVTKILMKVFNYSQGKAEKMMVEVHTLGRSVVWTGDKERVELYVQQLQAAQLTTSMEQA